MKVAYVLKMYPRFSETFILTEILELERQGVDVHIFSLKRPDDGCFHAELAEVRAPVTYVPASLTRGRRDALTAHRALFGAEASRYLRALRAILPGREHITLARFLQAGYIAARSRELGIDHVHAHFASTAASVAESVHRLTGIPFSFTAHAKDIYRHSVDPRVLFRKIDAARFVVTVTDHNVDYLREIHPSARIVRIYNGLDLTRFSPNGVGRAVPPMILAVGRLVEKKGFDDLVRACSLLRDEIQPFRCVIVGKGEELTHLQQLARDLRADDVVDFVGPLPRTLLMDLYRRASVVAAPCAIGADGNRDGLPTVLIEAMALGVPVVATDVTGIPELVRHGSTGLLVPQRDPDALAMALRKIVADPDLGSDLSSSARQLIEQSFDVSVNVAILRELLEGALD